MDMITTRAELLAYLSTIEYQPPNYRIAVEALIFNADGRLLLEKRGPKCRDEIGKLEGVGGSLGKNDNLIEKLREEFNQELAAESAGLEIAIERLLEIRLVQFDDIDKGLLDWIVVSYLCRLKNGTPQIGEPEKIESLHYLTLEELFAYPADALSKSTVRAREVYQRRYGSRPYYDVPEASAG